MTYEEKQEWLDRYRRAEKKAQHLNDELTQVQANAEHITQTLSLTPSGGGDGQALARAVERKDVLEREAAALRCQRKQYYREIFDALKSQVTDPVNYQILHERYLECRTWEKVAENTGFALRWVYTRHKRAVEQMQL